MANSLQGQFHQCLVLFTDRFGRDCPSFTVHLSIEEGIEVRGVDAHLVSDGTGANDLPGTRLASVRLPEVRKHWCDMDLTSLRATESLLLIVRVGVQQGDLRNRQAKDYKLTLAKN
ncbi:MAG: hypothetical protein JWO38_7845 [Gemmataceae bacterium]|nr:hypothetical protein [Gemmataceae bacterium]